MSSCEADDVPANWEQILHEVARGDVVDITRNGTTVARIVPVQAHDFERAAAAIDDLRRFRDEHNITLGEGVTIRDLIEEGRRF